MEDCSAAMLDVFGQCGTEVVQDDSSYDLQLVSLSALSETRIILKLVTPDGSRRVYMIGRQDYPWMNAQRMYLLQKCFPVCTLSHYGSNTLGIDASP